MIEHVHDHIISELNQNTKTDTIFIIAAILLNFIVLGINAGIAEKQNPEESDLLVMIIYATLTLVVNIVAIFGLNKGKQNRLKLTNGLLKMYKDQNVDGYYDQSLIKGYTVRYNLFTLVVVFLGLISIVVPFILK